MPAVSSQSFFSFFITAGYFGKNLAKKTSMALLTASPGSLF
ncbi:MAG: hypothetical protein ACTS73_06055 [Arsenophonus sp. NEOnobi-MAG3]